MSEQYEIDIEIPNNEAYRKLDECRDRYAVVYGGAGSGKSYAVALKLLMRMMGEPGHRFLIIRKYATTLRTSVYGLFSDIISKGGFSHGFTFTTSPMEIAFHETGSRLIFVGCDDAEKLKSIQGVTGIWIEEATELDEPDFTQIDLRLRGETVSYKQIILSFNPVSSLHWINRRFFQNPADGVQTFKTTYVDNKFIDDEYKRTLESLIDQDENFYRIYTLGEWGILKNVIFKAFPVLPSFPPADETIYGLDFGYNNPTALIRADIRDGQYFITEMIYEKGMTNSDLIARMKTFSIGNAVVYADAAEPQRIAELRRAGINAKPADKSVKDGIDYVKRMKIFSLSTNVNINKEVLSYKYKEVNGAAIDEPVKFMDHAMDAIRYAIFSHSRKSEVKAVLIH